MSCLSAEIIQAYLEGKATPDERGDVERHVQTCASCRDVLALAPPSDTSAPVPGQALARGILDALDKAMGGADSRDPSAWVEKAELLALAGDGEQARASLEHAAALNGLVQRSAEWKAAAALVAP